MRKTCQICSRQYEPKTNYSYYYGKTCSEYCYRKLRSNQSISRLTGFKPGHPPYGNATPGWHHMSTGLQKQKEGILRHNQEIAKEAERYRAEGFEVMELDKVRPDLIVRKDGRILAVEVECFTSHKSYSILQKKYAKYANCRVFDDIVWKVEGDATMKNRNNKGDILS